IIAREKFRSIDEASKTHTVRTCRNYRFRQPARRLRYFSARIVFFESFRGRSIRRSLFRFSQCALLQRRPVERKGRNQTGRATSSRSDKEIQLNRRRTRAR